MRTYIDQYIKANPHFMFGLCLFGVYLLVAFFLWPGLIRPDSLTQMNEALAGVYSDANPPLMAVYWRFLHLFAAGPGPLFLTHVTLLFGTLFLYGATFRASALKWYYLFIFFWPQVLFFASFVVKDVGFTFTFLLVISILSYATVRAEKISWPVGAAIVLLLFYGTGVKYQARFVLPVVSVWLAVCMAPQETFKKHLLKGALFFCLIFGAAQGIQSAVTTTPNHFWQWVKLFDLAAIGLDVKKDLVPDFNKEPVEGDFMAAIERQFNPERVDELTGAQGKPRLMHFGKNEQERDILWDTWFEAVKTYPLSYLKHRARLLTYTLTKSPIKGLGESSLTGVEVPGIAQKILGMLEHIGVLQLLKNVTSFLYFFPVMLVYIALGGWFFKRSAYAQVLFFMNFAALSLVIALFPFSMASDVRYIYFTMCCFHLSHPFAFVVLSQLRGK